MPVTVHAYTDLSNDNIRSQLELLYETSPEFGDGQDAVEQLEAAMQHNTLVYTAEFNTKVIGAVWVKGQGQERLIQYIVVHPANRGRGIAERLIDGVCQAEEQKGANIFRPGCGAIHRCLSHLGRL